MRTIWKYEILSSNIMADDSFTLQLPVMSKVMTVQIQKDVTCMWVMVPNTEAHTTQRKFFIYGTGNSILQDLHDINYIGTYQEFGGDLILHLFEANNDGS